MTDGVSSIASIEIITESYAIAGSCQGITKYVRLIDLLNRPEVTHLQLRDAEVREVLGSREIVKVEGPFFVEKQSVVLGRSGEPADMQAKRREIHRFDYVEKDVHLMLVFAPPFRILGNVHLVKDADLSFAVPKLSEGFMAITDAVAVREGERDVVFESKFIAVNGRRIELVCKVPDSYRQTHLTLASAIKQIGPADAEKSAA